MSDLANAAATALDLVAHRDPALVGIVGLSLQVSFAAVLLAGLAGLPLGAFLAMTRFRGRGAVIILINALTGLPPVLAGLLVYLLLSRPGPLGPLGLVFTPTAMVIAQALLVTPILAALSRQVLEPMWDEYAEQLRSFRVSTWRAVPTLLLDARLALVTVMLAGFGRASAEVGAVMIAGGNIDGLTRTMTTAIAAEAGKADPSLALALGGVLLLMVLAVNAAAQMTRDIASRWAG